MNPSLDLDAPGGLRIREGGGCLAAFGLPFLCAGVFLFLVTAGVIPLSNADEVPGYAWPLLALMATAFTAVGGGVAFGRSWTTLDRDGRSLRRQWGLLVPMREDVRPIHGATAVSLGFIPGDSDTAERYPVGLMIPGDAELPLGDFGDYGQARECARAVAEYLGVDVEDASSDHAVRVPASQMGLSFQERWRREGPRGDVAEAPAHARCRVHRDGDETRILIPSRRPHWLAVAAGLAPLAILLFIAPPFAEFFERTRTPAPVGWAFLGFMTLVLGVIPTVAVVNAFRRASRGATIVTVSRTRGLQVEQRGAWTTCTTARVEAGDILDVDVSVRESALAARRRATERDVQRLRHESGAEVGPRTTRLLTALGRFASPRGVIIKSRRGLDTFAADLEDAEIRYLADVVRRALAE